MKKNILPTNPKLFTEVSKPSLVVCSVTVKIFTAVLTTLNYLHNTA